MNRRARPHGGDFADVDGDAVGILDFEGGLLQVVGIEGRLAAQAIGIDRVAHVAQAAGRGGYIGDADADMQIIEHAGNVFRAIVALVLEDGEVVVTVGQVVADSSFAGDTQPQTVAPEADRLGEVGSSYTYMNLIHSFDILLNIYREELNWAFDFSRCRRSAVPARATGFKVGMHVNQNRLPFGVEPLGALCSAGTISAVLVNSNPDSTHTFRNFSVVTDHMS